MASRRVQPAPPACPHRQQQPGDRPPAAPGGEGTRHCRSVRVHSSPALAASGTHRSLPARLGGYARAIRAWRNALAVVAAVLTAVAAALAIAPSFVTSIALGAAMAG